MLLENSKHNLKLSIHHTISFTADKFMNNSLGRFSVWHRYIIFEKRDRNGLSNVNIQRKRIYSRISRSLILTVQTIRSSSQISLRFLEWICTSRPRKIVRITR